MKYSFFLFLLLCTELKSQNRNERVILSAMAAVKQNTVYLFCRGTASKLQLVSHEFNRKDTTITHIGIGFLKNDKSLIYNVTNISGTANALKIDSLESFIRLSDISCFSIWECKSTVNDYNTIARILQQYDGKKIHFDYSFLLNNGDSLYCTEFCATVLKAAGYEIKPSTMLLNNILYESILRRKQLVYYPVDFFENDQRFRKVFDYRF